MRRLVLAAVAFGTALGCLLAVPSQAVTTLQTVAYHGLALRQQPAKAPANKALSYHGPRPTFQVATTGWRAGEPTIGVDRHGVAYVAAGVTVADPGTVHTPAGSANTQFQSASFLASTDGGKTWHVDQASLAAGTGAGHPWFFDPYVYVEPASGRVFEGTLTDAGGSYFDLRDSGAWTRSHMYVPGINDHETVFAAPPPPGLTVTDKAFGKAVYYCVNQLVNAGCARSLDGGHTYIPTGGVAVLPEDPACEGLTGHGVADRSGRIYLPFQCHGPWISTSGDGGATWQQRRVDPGSTIASAPRTVHTSMAVDAADNLYYVWWDQTYLLPYLAVSRDHGRSWSTPRMVAPPDVRQTNLVTVGAGRAGRVALTFVGTGGTAWNLYTVLSTDALSANPTFLATVTNPGGPADPVHRGACQGACAGMLDYLDEPEVAPDRHGTVWVAAVDTCTGTCLRQGGAASDARGFVVRQLTGPWLR